VALKRPLYSCSQLTDTESCGIIEQMFYPGKGGNHQSMSGEPRRRQDDVLQFLHSFLADNGFAPTYDEIQSAVGLSSKSHVAHYLCALEQAGFIERVSRRPRGLRLVSPVSDTAGTGNREKPSSS
jgi:repressor LexA